MALKQFNPTSPGRRGLVLVDRCELHKGKPEKSLIEGLTKTGGRGGGGRIAVRFRGGGAKRLYRMVDFKRRKWDVAGDCRAARVRPQPHGLHRPDQVRRRRAGLHPGAAAAEGRATRSIAGEKVDVKPGNASPLRSLPIGSIVHNIELKPGKGGQIARSAGAYAQLVGRDAGYAQIRLGSGELRMVLDSCMATVGAVSNPDHMNEVLGKAGRVRHKGRRPHVRGVAMNPVDHPHGGGEGKTSGGRHPVTPWGKPTKGHKTRTNKATDKFIIRRAT